MAKHTGPRAESAAYKVICRLVDLGGTATTSRLMDVLSAEYRSLTRFGIQVTDILQSFRFITVNGGTFVATDAGKLFVARLEKRPAPVAAPYVGKVAPVRDVTPFKPLSYFALREAARRTPRAGAFTHRDIPSRMGNQRVLPCGTIVPDEVV